MKGLTKVKRRPLHQIPGLLSCRPAFPALGKRFRKDDSRLSLPPTSAALVGKHFLNCRNLLLAQSYHPEPPSFFSHCQLTPFILQILCTLSWQAEQQRGRSGSREEELEVKGEFLHLDSPLPEHFLPLGRVSVSILLAILISCYLHFSTSI